LILKGGSAGDSSLTVFLFMVILWRIAKAAGERGGYGVSGYVTLQDNAPEQTAVCGMAGPPLRGGSVIF
jgi:hypothetical protein